MTNIAYSIFMMLCMGVAAYAVSGVDYDFRANVKGKWVTLTLVILATLLAGVVGWFLPYAS